MIELTSFQKYSETITSALLLLYRMSSDDLVLDDNLFEALTTAFSHPDHDTIQCLMMELFSVFDTPPRDRDDYGLAIAVRYLQHGKGLDSTGQLIAHLLFFAKFTVAAELIRLPLLNYQKIYAVTKRISVE